MRQIWLVAAKEFRAVFKNKVFLVITLFFLLLSIVSVYIGSSTKNAELLAYTDIIAMLKKQGAASFPPRPQIYSLTVLKNIIEYVSMVGAVLAIFLGFDSFSGEKEQGTMKLLLSRPLYRDRLLSGKILGGAMVTGLLLAITFLFNTLLFSLISGMVPSAGEIGRLAVFIVLAFYYMMSFYVATLFVSIKSKDSSFVFVIMMVLWVGVSFVIPQLAESQKTFAYVVNSTAQTVTQLPAETAISKTIEIFSPAVHFQNLGKDLLQALPDTAAWGVGQIFAQRFLELIYLLVPGFMLLAGSYGSFLKEGD